MKNKPFLLSCFTISLLLCFAVLFACSSSSNEDNGDPNSGNGDSSSSDGSGNPNPSGSSSSNNNGNPGTLGAYAAFPSNMDAQRVGEMYNSWINTYYITYENDTGNEWYEQFIEEARGTARIKSRYSSITSCNSTSGNCTASEAIGYGMILTSLMEDWERFDKLLAYSKVFRIDGTALMAWDVRGFRRGVGGSATDADIDILASLFIAYGKTGNQNYLNDAREIGASIYEHEVDNNTKLILPAMNNETMGNGTLYNISYFSLPAIKMLAMHDNQHDWNSVLNANLSYMEMVQNAGDGLWPDWSDANGASRDPNNGSVDNLTSSDGDAVPSYAAYYKEAPRIPWRIAWYYHWFGDERAKAMLDKGMIFLNGKGVTAPSEIKSFYSYQGGKQGGGTASAIRWVSLCALGMGSSGNLEWLNSCNESVLNSGLTTAVGDYYRNSLQLIYAMLLNGRFKYD